MLRDAGLVGSSELLVGPQTLDDAGVVRLGSAGAPGMCLVQTVDYFPPVLDDPYWYGAVAAANALSDVYAMGGEPLSVLNLAGFPAEFPDEWIREILRGGFEKVREAGAIVAGGHTVRSEEPLFGFAVTGLVHEDKVIANSGAQAGDVLYLTKPLGMGSITTGNRKGLLTPEELDQASRVMATLNREAAHAMIQAGAKAATDITGFGLVGHAHNIAAASQVTLAFDMQALPLYPRSLELARQGVLSGGSARSQQAVGHDVEVGSKCDPALVKLVFDAETSGGLLISIARHRADALEAELTLRDVPVERVGEVLPPGKHRIMLR
ncbi:MAG: selenide, water dikinase SelD [Planctomycetes bacterium]|nr:selenide, water dikinase SelD [Planctomycetota bacterium]MCB9910104.1 selenide, water dikinase SelD [Planctomycetota bacterium]